MGKWAKPGLSYLENDLSNNSIKSISWQLINIIIPKKVYAFFKCWMTFRTIQPKCWMTFRTIQPNIFTVHVYGYLLNLTLNEAVHHTKLLGHFWEINLLSEKLTPTDDSALEKPHCHLSDSFFRKLTKSSSILNQNSHWLNNTKTVHYEGQYGSQEATFWN